MRAAALDRFGGIENIHVKQLPVPEPGPDEVLLHIESAGVGVWDPYEREGEFAKMSGGEATDRALRAMNKNGHVAYPNGVEPEPKAPSGVRVQSYDIEPSPEQIEKLNRLIESGPFEVHIARTFPLDKAADAHRELDKHYLGKLALRPQ